jgi:DNA polymerase-3 subunit gamma/tau
MAYENTATRKRPQRFSELIGQEFVAATLTSSIAQGRIAHAYLFSGPRGVGKTSAARILARALNCEQGPTAEPCGTCGNCREVTAGNSLDVIEIDGASNTSVNDVREIKDEVLFAPNSSRYKVYIIDEVHMLSNSAFNALLKTIEEPPPYIVFIFATTEVHKVPATIRSRCQQFNFRLIPPDQIKASLKAVVAEMQVKAEEQALSWVAKEATGSLRDAYTLLDQVISFSEGEVTLERIQEKLGVVGIDEINRIGRLLMSGEPGQTLESPISLLDRGVSVEQFVIDLADYFRNLLFLKAGIRREALLSFPAESYAGEVLETLSLAQLEKAVEMLLDLYRDLKFSLNQRFELELVMSRMSNLSNLITPGELLESIRSLQDDRAGRREGGTGGDAENGADAVAIGRDAGAPTRGRDADAGPAARQAQPNGSARGPGARREAAAAGAGVEAGVGPEGDAEPAGGATAEEAGPPLLERLAEALRREKLALASSIQKADSLELKGEELSLSFQTRDKFSAEMVLREREAVAERAAQLLGRRVHIRVRFLEADRAGETRDSRVDLVKKVFRGEVVQKEKSES